MGAHIFHCGMCSSGNLNGIVDCCGISSGIARKLKYVNIWGRGNYPLKLLRIPMCVPYLLEMTLQHAAGGR